MNSIDVELDNPPTYDRSMALTGQPPVTMSWKQKLAVLIGMFGLSIVLLAAFNLSFPNKSFWFSVAMLSIVSGTVWFAWEAYMHKHPEIGRASCRERV